VTLNLLSRVQVMRGAAGGAVFSEALCDNPPKRRDICSIKTLLF